MSNTVTATPVFVERVPDWKRDYIVDQVWTTTVLGSHDSAEQRANMRTKPRWMLSYGPAAMAPAAYSAWKALLRRASGSTIVVPMWHWPIGVTVDNANLFTPTIDADLFETTPFKVGSYAYFTGAFTAHFRLITSLEGGKIACASGNSAYPNAALPSYGASVARVFPCVVGTMQENRFDATMQKPTQTEGRLTIEEL